MATVPLTAEAPRALAGTSRGYWLFDRNADLGWFVLSVFVPMAVYLPAYFLIGQAAVWPLYVLYVVGFATPHTWFTYAVTTTPTSRGMYSRASFWGPFALTMTLVAAIPLAEWAGQWDLYFTLVTMFGFYHVYKQHLGMLRLYDAKYADVYGDPTVFAANASFHSFAALAFAAPIAWVWIGPQFEVVVGVQRFVFLHPELPTWAIAPFVLALLGFAGHSVMTWSRRAQAGKPMPWGHLGLTAAALLSYVVAFGLIPPRDYLLTVAIFITYHDLQYAGFVWNFQQKRADVESAERPLDVVHRWARERRVLPYFGLAFAFSLVVCGTLVAVPPAVALALIVLHNNLHYFMDGAIWQRRHNPSVHAHLGIGQKKAAAPTEVATAAG